MHVLNPDNLNNTKNAGIDMVFFNRVPKVGSQSFNELIRRLSLRNNFHFNRDTMHQLGMGQFSDSMQKEYVDMLSDLEMPSGELYQFLQGHDLNLFWSSVFTTHVLRKLHKVQPSTSNLRQFGSRSSRKNSIVVLLCSLSLVSKQNKFKIN